MIRNTKSRLHWNYFLAIEQDMERVSRYVEFCEANLKVFSVELAHLLLAAASEVDVLAKCICEIIKPDAPRGSIDDYRRVFMNAAKLQVKDANHIPSLAKMEISVPRYGMSLTPWDNWAKGVNPDWWRSYNHVKHERNKYFHEATLRNALNALGALIIMNYYYQFALTPPISSSSGGPGSRLPNRRLITRYLQPHSKLLSLPPDCYEYENWRTAGFGLLAQ